ncbi:arginase [Crocinitomix algicola]|uniref:arginase n=1 Tax=Crocinitomix algicola TaxID=1740263 RepID=UPI000832A90A|nr:arginase [Crocinitomix algicola]
MAEIKIIENMSELGAGTRGASLGIGALQVVARQRGENFFGQYERFMIEHQNDMLDFPTKYTYAKWIDGLANVYQQTADVVNFVLQNKDFPLVLSGDHSCAAGTISGIKKAFPNKRLGVIWIDAHADLHTPYTTPSGNVHGMPLAVALGENNMESASNTPNPDVVEMWEELKNIGAPAPKVLPDDLVFISLRDTEKPEDEYMARNGVKNFSVDEVRQKSKEEVAKEIKEKLSACDIIYVSFDVDSMDSILVSKGTGTPVENGLSPEEANYFVNEFASWEKTCCVEMVEINPCLDNKINKMAETAYDILRNTAATIEKKIK